MRDRRGYARTLTAGLSLALALFASGCLVAGGAEDEAPELAREPAGVTATIHVASREASATLTSDTRGLWQSPTPPSGAPSSTQGVTDVEETEEASIPPEDSEADYYDTTAAHEQIGGNGDGVFLEPPPHPYTPPPLR
jgi:hypothetical protein